MMELNIRLHSHSSDELSLIKRGDGHFIVKKFIGDIDRKKRCVDKQKFFTPILEGEMAITSAPIIFFEADVDSAVLEMPFIEGHTGLDFAVYGNRDIAIKISMAISDLLKRAVSQSKPSLISRDIFSEKILDVIDNVSDRTLLAVLHQVVEYVENLPDTLNVPLGPCHGDLTFSNMILNPASGIVLIDFLDTYLESPLQDVAKINQDFLCGWTSRNASASLQTKLSIFSRYAYPKYINELSTMYKTEIHLFTIFALARIAPYIEDVATTNWLNKRLHWLLNK